MKTLGEYLIVPIVTVNVSISWILQDHQWRRSPFLDNIRNTILLTGINKRFLYTHFFFTTKMKRVMTNTGLQKRNLCYTTTTGNFILVCVWGNLETCTHSHSTHTRCTQYRPTCIHVHTAAHAYTHTYTHTRFIQKLMQVIFFIPKASAAQKIFCPQTHSHALDSTQE